MSAVLEGLPTRSFQVPDVGDVRRRATSHVFDRSLARPSDRAGVRGLLNDALATEAAGVLRYRRHHAAAIALHEEIAARAFERWADEARRDAGRLAARIVELGGEPEIDPAALSSRPIEENALAARSLPEMIREDLVAKRIGIEILEELIRFVADDDSATRRLLESIQTNEEEHAEILRGLLLERRRPAWPSLHKQEVER